MTYGTASSAWRIVLLIPVLVLCCSDNSAVRLRYQAEKAAHYAEKSLQEIHHRVESADESSFREVTDRFGHAADYSLASLDSIDSTINPLEYQQIQQLAFQTSDRLSRLFYARGQFDTCRSILSRLPDRMYLNTSQQVSVRLNLGKTWQASGFFDSALAIYRNTLQVFYPPVNDSGEVIDKLLDLPAHLFRVTEMTGDSSSAANMLTLAEQYYLTLLDDCSGAHPAAAVRAGLIRLYNHTGQWNKEITQLQVVLDSNQPAAISTASSSVEHARQAIKLRLSDIYATNPDRHQQALTLYREILDSLAPSDTILRPQILFGIGETILAQGDHSRARQKLLRLKREYPKFFAATPPVQRAIARSFELEGNFNRAELEYLFLIESFRGTDEAMAAYLHLADHYDKQNRMTEAARWYRQAEQNFDEVATMAAGTATGAGALSYKADLYLKRRDWRRSAEILLDLFGRYPHTEAGRRALHKAANIYRRKLDNRVAADSLIKVLKTGMAEIEQLR
ncbi:MAG: tetratricopeptide repeat protein [bacterium]